VPNGELAPPFGERGDRKSTKLPQFEPNSTASPSSKRKRHIWRHTGRHSAAESEMETDDSARC
jgi:hypothetical protein